MSDYADIKVNGGTGSLPYLAEGGKVCEQQTAALDLLRMWNLIGMCAFCLNR